MLKRCGGSEKDAGSVQAVVYCMEQVNVRRCGGGEKDAGSVHAVVQYMEQVNVRRCGGGEKASLNASDTASKLQCR